MTRDEETLACALHVERVHGANGPKWIAERIATLALQNDAAGVERWHEIATAYEGLLTGKGRA